MDSSDDDWAPSVKPPGLSGATTSDTDMLAARRQALRQQREAQMQRQEQQKLKQKQQQQTSSEGNRGSARRPPAAGRLGSVTPEEATKQDSESPMTAQESSMPAAFLGLDSSSDSNEGASPPARVQSPAISERPPTRGQTRTPAPAVQTPSPTTQQGTPVGQHVTVSQVEELKRQVEAKKKLLKSMRERETALLDKWRADKALKHAEMHQLDAKLHSVWATVEDEKSAAETQVRTAQDDHEKEMRTVRQDVERELKALYEPKIAELQNTLNEKKEAEAALKSLLQSQGENEDLVKSAVAAALSSIVGRMETAFAEEQKSHEVAWSDRICELVRHEVRSSFAVSAASESQAEREELRKGFEETLAFWRSAEDEIQQRVVKLDDALLADVQSTLHEDLGRLQREQLSMEEIYVQSREAWAVEHQRLLQAEFETSMRRREEEMEEFRKLRHQLHVEKMQNIDTVHEARMHAEEACHEKEMAQLREYFNKEEELRDERQRMTVAVQEDVAKSMDVLKGVVGSCDTVMSSIKSYQTAVEESRVALESERRRTVEDQESSLATLQSLMVRHTTSIEDEHRGLSDALSKLRVVETQVQQQLETEAVWLSEQESAYESSRTAWEREYRQWKACVQRDRRAVEERFADALTALQNSLSQLSAEEKDTAAEAAATELAYGELIAAADKESDTLRAREADLLARQQQLEETLVSLEGQREQTSAQWRALQAERASLASEREALLHEEGKLEQTARTLDVLKSQMAEAKSQAAATAERNRILQHQLVLQKELYASLPSNDVATASTRVTQAAAAPVSAPSRATFAMSGRQRLPEKVLADLRAQLQGIHQLSEYPVTRPPYSPFGLAGLTHPAHAAASVPHTQKTSSRQRHRHQHEAFPLDADKGFRTPRQSARHADPVGAEPSPMPSTRVSALTRTRQQAVERHAVDGGVEVDNVRGETSRYVAAPRELGVSEISGVTTQTFTNLLALSDADSVC